MIRVGALLTTGDIMDVLARGKLSLQRYAARSDSHYPQSPSGVYVGHAGEAAVERYWRRRGYPVEAHWRDPDREDLCDVEVAGVRIEVKTWARHNWVKLGRCVRPTQLPAIEDKADVIVWAMVDADLDVEEWELRAARPLHAPAVFVVFQGCSTPAEVRAAPVRPTGALQLENHQLDEVCPFLEWWD